jgi:diguanylate cyclase (GGDEF)-like protein
MRLRASLAAVALSIRARILVGCLALSMLTVALGVYAHLTQLQIAQLATSIYDDAFMGLSFLRSAQVEFAGLVHSSNHTAPEPASIAAVLDDLRVVSERAMSAVGRSEVDALRVRIAAAAPDALAPLQGEFDNVVERFAGDGFRYRHSLTSILAAQVQNTWLAVSISVLAAILITAAVTRMIAPPIRRAARVAQSIAEGKLDNAIEVSGHGETGDLLRALSVMQGNIAAAMHRIHSLMADQASDHQSELLVQHAKLEAALDNMNQGLCLFDADNRLVIANRRFAELFGPVEPGASAASLLVGSGLGGLMKHALARQSAVFSCDLPDGRNIAVTQRPIRTGGWVATYEDITARRETEAKLAHMARHDQLTGLANRLLFREHMVQVLGHAQAPETIAVLCLDLDGFKLINEGFGHGAGDLVLHTVARRLRDCTRESDLVVRLGSDEFVVVQGGTRQPAAAMTLAHRLIAAVAEPIEVDGQQVVIGTSIGIAVCEAATDTAEMLLRSADIALHRAKADGRGTFQFFEPDMDMLAQARRKLEVDLRGALALDQFELFYQPLVGARNGEIEGFEALVRWRRSEQGLISPAIFIPVAEEIGLIGALGEWVINRACCEAAAWPGELMVAVNLSPAQFRNGALVEQVQAALQLSGLPAGRLELEITESVLLQDEPSVMNTLFGLRNLGVRIAMDDFGTGYSSLSYLRRFPFDKIKIDQSFVQGVVDHDDCRAIVRAVIGLGHSLGIAVNAEGVETSEQRDVLRAEGCGQLQGYLFSKPRPAADIGEMLAAHGYVRSASAA